MFHEITANGTAGVSQIVQKQETSVLNSARSQYEAPRSNVHRSLVEACHFDPLAERSRFIHFEAQCRCSENDADVRCGSKRRSINFSEASRWTMLRHIP